MYGMIIKIKIFKWAFFVIDKLKTLYGLQSYITKNNIHIYIIVLLNFYTFTPNTNNFKI